MKITTQTSVILIILYIAITAFANPFIYQTPLKKIASTDVRTLDGKTYNTASISNNGKPIIISIWETTCKPCINELDAISDQYEQWQKETGVKLIAISIDGPRTIGTVESVVKSRGWEYEVYKDVNQDFKRAMNIGFCPYTYLLDSTGNIVWEKGAYLAGDETILYELVKKLSRGEKILGN
ncbi:MAG: TlpA disulfide reductase family protein [Bacteroidota bacterium]|nr:TlpA disulfide reductase family protein [Bacteroidota bacterium]